MNFTITEGPFCPKRSSFQPFHIQLLRAMKLTIVLLIAVSLHLSATGFGQKVSISGKDLSLEKVFTLIKKQTSYVFFYDYSIFQGARPVSLDLKDAEVEDVLRACLRDQNLDFSITNKTISITKKAVKATIAPASPGTPPEVVGTVRSDNGTPLAGATVFIKNLNKSGATNALGEFILKDVPNGKYSVEISYIGYEKYVTEILVDNHEVRIVADMKLAKNSLDETVVKGYYNTTKRLNTGNVATLKGEDIQKQPVTDPLLAMEGRIAGLYISSNSDVLPGSSSTVRIRGQNSIASGNNPFYIIDGVPIASSSLTTISSAPGGISPFNSLNTSDIESIEVLKDADATAIYGSRGANGVILITTKKGKAGKTKFDINLSTGFNRPTRKIKLLNTQEYLKMRHDAFSNDNVIPGAKDYDINGTWDTTRYTDWQKEFIGKTAQFSNAQTSISGGNINTQFVISGGYSKQTTLMPGDFSDQKGSVHFNLTHTSSDQRFHALISANYVNDNSNMPLGGVSNNIFLIPDAPAIYDANGNLNWANGTFANPFATLLKKAKANTDNLISNLNLNYEILPGLQLNASMGYNNDQLTQVNTIPLTSYSPANSSNPKLRQTQYGNNSIKTWIIEPQLNYNKRIGNGSFSVLIGTTFQQNVQKSINITGSNYTSDALLGNISAAASFSNITNGYTLYHYNAIYGRVNYNCKEKYLINLTARRDGSSRFGASNQFGSFGAVGIGWIFSKENFVQHSLPFLSFGKIRASYGSTGNDQIADYQYLSTYSPISLTYQNISGLYPVRLPNPYYGWELDKKLEGGLELGILKDKVLLTTSYYYNRTGNQLVGYSLPTLTGFPSVQANLPAIIQNTGLEITLNTINIRRGNFTWNTNFNLTAPHNKLVSYPNLVGSSYANMYVIGQPLSIKKLYHYTGIDPNTGIYTFQDVNKDGKITSPDDLTSQKNTSQVFFGGLQNTFNYRGFQLDVFFQFVKQMGYNYLNTYSGFPGAFSLTGNPPEFVLDYWKATGEKSGFQKVSQNFSSSIYTANVNLKNSDYGIADASFVRLKNLSLSYQLLGSWKKNLHIESGRIYVQCQNLITTTKYKGVDPENQGFTPPVRTIIGGIQLTF